MAETCPACGYDPVRIVLHHADGTAQVMQDGTLEDHDCELIALEARMWDEVHARGRGPLGFVTGTPL